MVVVRRGWGRRWFVLFFCGVLLVFLLMHSWVCSLLGDAKRQQWWRTGVVALSRPRVTFRMCPTTQVVSRRCAVSDARSLSIASTVQCHGLVCLAMLTSPMAHRRRGVVSASRDLSNAPPAQVVLWRCALSDA